MKEKDFGKTAIVPTRRNPVVFGVRRGLDSDVSGGRMLVRIQLSAAGGRSTKHLHVSPKPVPISTSARVWNPQ